jgi:hypothetical protein
VFTFCFNSSVNDFLSSSNIILVAKSVSSTIILSSAYTILNLY